MDDLIEVHPYDPAWPAEYAREREAVLARLGPRVAAVEHIGSTAIPGIAAKPTIDLMVGVETLSVDEEVVDGLEALGYRYLGEYGIAGRHFFRKGSPPTHHLHWVRRRGDFWWKQVVFRDYMRACPEEAGAYEHIKRALAEKFREDRARYTASKGPFINGALERAWRWSKAPLIVYDLEATCWDWGTTIDRQEVIEVGAVRLDGDLKPAAEFQRFVRPTSEPSLSAFCTGLTGIRQEDVDAAETFPAVLASFAGWAGDGPLRFASWGAYDLRQLRADCRRHEMPLPAPLECYLDLRQRFSESRGIEPQTMKRALELSGLSLDGSHHRGIDDARNTARLAGVIFGVSR